ncbi:MAG: flagellar hook-associated protein FlgL [Deltaproteobacteria bacterium]|nr:flagellar hook-associated protein FlgL [Deltaproteobacteria bacterium]
MRVSSFQAFQQVTDSLMKNLADLFRLNEQISSGKRINRPSDDVRGTARALDYRLAIDSGEQYRKNADDASTAIAFAEKALTSVSSALTRTKEIALQAASGTQSDATRDALAQEAFELRDQFLSLSNSRLGSRYIFSGFRTDAPAFDALFAYQGDTGSVNVAVDKDVLIPKNVIGTEAFGYSQAAEETVTQEDGTIVHYIPGGGTTVNVEIRASDDTTVLDSFSFDNVMQMTGILSQALESNDTARISAILKTLDDAAGQVTDVRADLGARLNRLDDQGDRLDDAKLAAQIALSGVEDVDLSSAASEIVKTDATLQALRASAGKILSRSLLDFLS